MQESTRSNGRNDLTILVADDHTIVRKAVVELLKEEFPLAQFEHASDAAEVISLEIKIHFDLIICDLNMPGRSGLEAVKHIRQRDPGVPIIIISVAPEDLYAVRAFRAGASAYLYKGDIHAKLISTVHTVLSGKKLITPEVGELLAHAFTIGEKKEAHQLLSDREFEVLKLLAAGKKTREIAAEYMVSQGTVRAYRNQIMKKMNFKTSSDLIRYVLEKGIIQ